MKVYFYKLTADNGGAPCVQNGLLSLAICKPMIRITAACGDLIVGFAANSLHRDNRLLFVALITEKVPTDRYYEQYAHRGDCIYQKRGKKFVWREGALHHGPEHLVHDLGSEPDYHRANVLLSTDFRYFGAAGTDKYKSSFPIVKDAVEKLGIGHRLWHDEPLQKELLELKKQVWRDVHERVAGWHTSAPRRSACHRSRSCGVLTTYEDC